MNLMDSVFDLLHANPGATADDLMPKLPGYTRRQIMQALQNLAFTDRATCKRSPSQGRGKGTKPGRYYPRGASRTVYVPRRHPLDVWMGAAA